MSWSSGPVPGDPVAVRRAAADYADVAEAIRSAATRLREIAEQRADRSDAVAAVASQADEVAGQISRARARYRDVGRALGAYAVRLDAVQSTAAAALRAGRSAQDDQGAAAARERAATVDLESATPEDRAARTRALEDARADREAAERALERVQDDLDRAVASRDAAAELAATAIRAAMHDGLDDGWWQNWGKELVQVIAALADSISNIAGILALITACVPGLGELFALVAVLAAAVKLLADVCLALDGEAAWGDVMWDAAGLIPGGVGKGVGAMARTTTGAAAGTARREAERLAALHPQRDREFSRLLGNPQSVMGREAAEHAVASPSLRRALKEAVDLRVEYRGAAAGRQVRTGTPWREWWHDTHGAPWATRALGDRELAANLRAVRAVSPDLLEASPATAKAISRAAAWRHAATGAYAAGALDAIVGPQDLADKLAGRSGYAPGVWHAFESFGAVRDDGESRRTLQLAGGS